MYVYTDMHKNFARAVKGAGRALISIDELYFRLAKAIEKEFRCDNIYRSKE